MSLFAHEQISSHLIRIRDASFIKGVKHRPA